MSDIIIIIVTYALNVLIILDVLFSVAFKVDRTVECGRIEHSSLANFIYSYMRQCSFNLVYSIIKFFTSRSYEKPSFYIAVLLISGLILVFLSFIDVFLRSIFLFYHIVYALYLKYRYRVLGSFLYILSYGIEKSKGRCIHIRAGFIILNMRRALEGIKSVKGRAKHRGIVHARVLFAKTGEEVIIGATYTSSKKVKIGDDLFKTKELSFNKGLAFGSGGLYDSEKQSALFSIGQKPDELLILEGDCDIVSKITKVKAMKYFGDVLVGKESFVAEHYSITSEVIQKITRIDNDLDKGFKCAMWGLYNSFYDEITRETMLEFDESLIYEIGQAGLSKGESYEAVVQKLNEAYERALNNIDGGND